MSHISRLMKGIGLVVLMWMATGCVDEQPSMELRGIILYEGTIDSETVTCGGGDGEDSGEDREAPVLSCNAGIEPGNVENFRTELTIDISDFEERGGQLSPGAGDGGADTKDICSSSRDEYFNQNYRRGSFVVGFDSENLLEDSREVGAEGEGGGGGGFNGLPLDKSDIETRSLNIRFPNVENSDELGLDRNIDFTMLAESGGGGAAFNLALYQRGDITENMEKAHQELVAQRAGLTEYNDRAQRTTVTLTSEMWIEGETLGGREVESNKMNFPVRLCGKGCGTTPQCNFQSGG